MWGNRIARAVALLFAAALSACGTVAISPPPEDAPLFRRIDARVGTSYASAARLAYVTNPLMRVEVGQASVARFEKAFDAMFTETIPLPDWPPWRHETPKVDGVIELERGTAELQLGDIERRPDVASVAYRVCLYEPDGIPVRCWTSEASSTHQRREVCMDLARCVLPHIEVVIREAIALFLVEAENDPALRAWSERLEARREKR